MSKLISAISKIFGRKAPSHIKVLVGSDHRGNRYYEIKKGMMALCYQRQVIQVFNFLLKQLCKLRRDKTHLSVRKC